MNEERKGELKENEIRKNMKQQLGKQRKIVRNGFGVQFLERQCYGLHITKQHASQDRITNEPFIAVL